MPNTDDTSRDEENRTWQGLPGAPRAVILAGGRGSRLSPLTTVIPKPLVPVGDVAIIEVLIRQLVHYGITDVTICLGYLGHLIRAVLGDGHQFGADISYTEESEPLGTAGALHLVDTADADTVIVLNGDTLTDIDFADIIAQHHANSADASIVVLERNVHVDFGVIDIGGMASVRGLHREADVFVPRQHRRQCAVRGGPETSRAGRTHRHAATALAPARRRACSCGANPPRRSGSISAESTISVKRARCSRRTVTGSFPDDGVRPIVVIGASGWLGRAVAAEAAATALGVVSVGRSAGSDVEITSYDVADLNAILRSLAPQSVINCAGLVRGSAADLRAANVDLVRSVVAAARDLPLRFVQIGSAAEYGDPGSHGPVDEGAGLRPTSEYGRSKALAAELALRSGVDAVVARVFNVAGPEPAPGSLLADFLRKVETASTDIRVGNADHGARLGNTGLRGQGDRRAGH